MQKCKAAEPVQQGQATGLWSIVPFCLLIMSGMGLAMLWPRGSYLLVVAPPLSSPAATMAIIAGADGALVQQGRFDWLAVAYSAHPDFAARLQASGAVLVLASPLTAGCLIESGARR
ncbi:hypothetical protein [Allorhizobium taibaishanense]|uniref:Uncharacterized protein n=1 Tax=Allorhizobium taibaishanense TaxID=887144 RepID=A0A1Q9A4N4_9HYPH|nr:hypothetical protein [Allorhizobium taibaishanense]MBB4006590.1 hypothetical protein [Allorhizobium taibaishanense]OLP49512.1 hypothetical protein BJF91_21015 [Allorhizobium taibaishanense]